jgi:serine/threonine protein kinase
MVRSHNRLRRIFEAAAKISSADEREKFLAGECGEDTETFRDVSSLLEAHWMCEGFLSELVPATPADDAGLYSAGTTIGPYKILDLLGEGGMGLVYSAQQSTPVSRLVALKVIKPGMDSRQILSRFRSEMQTLAMMSHPNIARVLDGGMTDDGRPYFVMELVCGIRVDHFCDQRELPVNDRIALFTTICEAVHHAHTKGVIHRDLKPANVLVEDHAGQLVPKVIDFGVAKALNEESDDGRTRTHVTQRIGTPAFMSPEQASASHPDVDIRSDVYSLGVLLYQSLTGTLPSDSETTVANDGSAHARPDGGNHHAERPSRQLRRLNARDLLATADRRDTKPDALISQLQGELDWILLKALDPDRERRYQSAYDLRRDLQRFLNNETVDACPPTVAYRLRKLASRNRNSLVAVTAVAVAVLLGLFGTSWYAVTSEQARKATSAALALAERHAAEAEAASVKNSELLYAAEMKAAAEFLRNGDVRNSAELLKPYAAADPFAGDLRGFEWYFLQRQLARPGEVIAAAAEQACLVRFSPDQRTLLIGRSDGTITLLDAADKAVIASFHRQSGFVNDCSFHPDGKRVATIADDGVIRIWDLDSRTEEQSIPGFERHGNRVSFIGEGAVVAASGEAPEVRFWDVATGARLPLQIDLARADGPVNIKQRSAYSAELHLIAACDGVEHARLYGADTGEVHAALEGVDKWHQVRTLRFSPAGRYIAAAMKDRTVRVWSTDSGKLLATFAGHRDQVLSLAFHPQGNVLASG